MKDGIETSLEYREFEKREKRQRKLPLCAVTGNASDAQVQRIKSAGIDFVLSKPYQIGDLIDFVRTLPPVSIFSIHSWLTDEPVHSPAAKQRKQSV